jgi:peptidoglycan/LPS O-acetylase OafA/YrhL
MIRVMIESDRGGSYRPDIDGLRGIAVLGVLLYHLDIGPLRGGFVGVDIFFVISGYLITGIIHREIQQGRFTFAGFYERRVRRIFPALFAVLSASALVGLWLLFPTDLLALGKSTLATLFFGSNVLSWRGSGYFAGSSEFNPLLHMWSLAVEEQFYIALPVLLLLAHRRAGSGRLAVLLIGVGVLSLAACVAVQPLRPSAVFFLSPFRAWELLAGGLLAIGAVPGVRTRWHRELLSVLALVLLGASLVMTKAGEAFPGWQAVVPVFATAVLLHAGAHGTSTVRRMLQLKPLTFVGMISYSLYLWHWPILVFAKYLNAFEPLKGLKWIVLLLSAVSAIMSYYWVEQPFRVKGRMPARLLFKQAGWAFGGLALAAMVFAASGGLPGRFSDRVVALDRAGKPEIPFLACCDHTIEQNRRGDFCLAGDPAVPPSLLIWGDSHSLALAPAFDAVLKGGKRSALLAMESSCPPLLGVLNPHDPGCKGKNDAVFAQIRRRKDISMVVMAAAWTSYSARSQYLLRDDEGREGNVRVFPPALKRTVGALRRLGKRVWIIGPTPGAPSNIPSRLAMADRSHRRDPQAISLSDFTRRAAEFDAALPAALAVGGVFYTDPRPWFCERDGRCDYMRSGELLYRDDGHLSVQGTRFLAPYLEREISRFGREPWWASKAALPASRRGAGSI